MGRAEKAEATLSTSQARCRELEAKLEEVSYLGVVHIYPDDWDYAGQGGGPSFDDCEMIDLSAFAPSPSTPQESK